ncbi:MAG: ATP phosphoribosyltransferase [Chloroflexi bacterium]|nr:ATP phosphoribosyltransferase [Chloroflexota bacterium]
MSQNGPGVLRLAIPSDGELYEPTLGFLNECGLAVDRGSARQYTGALHGLDGSQVLFQRSADITGKVEERSADLGIVGLDRYTEGHREAGAGLLVCEDLGYGRCELVTAVPEAWIDVTEMADLADLAAEFRERGRDLRVATKYPRLTREFFFRHGIHYIAIVPSSGTVEAAPLMGFADIIVDISATGATLRENRLKTLADGTVLRSQACVIANRTALQEDPGKLELARQLIERVEGYLQGRHFFRLSANVPGTSAEQVARAVLDRSEVAGLRGPTVAQVYTAKGESWFAVTVVVPRARLQQAVDHLRSLGGSGISVIQPRYVYQGTSPTYQRLLAALRDAPAGG